MLGYLKHGSTAFLQYSIIERYKYSLECAIRRAKPSGSPTKDGIMAYGARSACIPALEPYPWIILLPWLVRVDTGPTVLKTTGFEAASFLPVSCEAGVAPKNCSGTTCFGAVRLDEIASFSRRWSRSFSFSPGLSGLGLYRWTRPLSSLFWSNL